MKIEDHKALLRECALPAALEAVGERWSFLILRGVFNGLHHFEEFQSTLGIARNILSRSEEHTSELQSLMRISYAVFCWKQNTRITTDFTLISNAILVSRI